MMKTQESFILTPEQVTGSALAAHLKSLSESQRSIKIETIDSDEQLYSGNTQDPWNIEGWNQPVKVTFRFRRPEKEEIVIVSINLELVVDGYSLNFICEQPEKLLLFECHASQLGTVFPNLKGIVSLNCFITNNALPGFIHPTNLRYQLQIDPGEAAFTSHRWISDQTDLTPTFWNTGNLPSPIQSLVLINELFSTNSSDNHPINYRLKGEFFLGKTCNVEVRPSSDRQLIIDLSAEGGLPALDEIAESMKLEELHTELEQFYEDFPGLNQLVINRIRLMVATDNLAIRRIELFGSVELFEVTFNFSLSYPRFHFQTRLSPLTPIPLGKVLKQWFPGGTGLPEKMQVTGLAFNLQTSPLRIRMSTTVNDIWDFSDGKTSVQLKEINFGFSKNTNGIQGQVQALLTIGDIDFQLFAGNEDPASGYLFRTEIAHKTGISLTNFLNELGKLYHFEIPPSLPQITLENVDLSFHTTSYQFQLSATAKLEEKFGPIDKGSIRFDLDLTKNQSGVFEFNISLRSTIEMEQTRIHGEATFGTSGLKFDLQWTQHEGQGLHLTHLLSSIDPDFDVASIPEELEHLLTLSMISVTYDSSTKEFSGELRTEGGQELFVSGRGGKDGGLLAGLGYHQPEDIPHFGEHLSDLQHEIQLTDLWLVLNTFGKDKQLPDLPDIFPSAIRKDLRNKKLTLLATLDLENGHNHGGLAEIAKQSPHSKLTVIGAILDDGISIKADLKGGITFPLQKNDGQENQLRLDESFLEFSVRKTGFNFELGASMQFVIDHMPLHPSLRLSISEKALRTAGRIQFGDDRHDGWNIFGLKGVEIQEIAILLGVEFVTAALEFGLFGKVRIAAIEPVETGNYFDFGIILELHGEIPNIQYFALSIQKVDFTQLIKALFFNGSNAPSINTTLKGEDLSIYMAESRIKLPDGTETNPGFGLHGLVTIFDWKAYAHLDAHPDSGIRGQLQLSPIVSDWFELTGNSEAVIVNGYIDPKTKNWVTLRNAGESVPENVVITTKELVEAGGPVLHLDTTASPYLSASAHVKLLHFLTTDLDILVSDELLDFNVHFEVKHLADFRLHCTLKNGKELSANGNFFAGVDIEFDTPFEHIKLEIGIRAAMELQVGPKPKDFKVMLKGSIDFMGADINIAELKLDGFPNNVQELPFWLGMQFTRDCLPALHELFKKGYDELHAQSEVFDQTAYEYAMQLLEQTREWAQFVDNDIREMQQEQAVSFLNAKEAARQLNAQSDRIEQNNRNRVNAMRHKRLAELNHLKQLEHLMGDYSGNQLERINLGTAIRMDNLQREINELRDENETIRKAILALWDQTRTTDVDTRSPQEQSEAILRQSNDVDHLLATIILTLPTGKNMLYPEQTGKFLPRAVRHHAALIAQDKISAVQTAAILAQAEAQVSVILNQAQQDVQSIHNLHTHGNR